MAGAAESFLPPLKAEEIFKRTRGKVANVGGCSYASKLTYLPKGLSVKEKAAGIAYNRAESMVKLDKASSGIKTKAHMRAALEYIARHGKFDVENEQGEVLDLDKAVAHLDDWCADMQVPDITVNNKRPADARKIIVSCPPGADPQKVKAAARQLGKEIFQEQGFEYFMVLHCRDELHPKEPLHPHVHFLVRAVNDVGRRLNLRKADLRYMRERFAVIAKDYGIELNATSRAVRGQTLKAKTQARIHQEERDLREKKEAKQSQAQKWAIHRKKQAGKNQHPYQKQRQEELENALTTGKEIGDHPVLRKAKATRCRVLENVAAYINELKKGTEEDKVIAEKLKERYSNLSAVESAQQLKLRIAKRKLMEKATSQYKNAGKQSQAQKWAIHRKKQQSSQDFEH
ncbi:relaxase/mobilization nuclease domain-containing protein [Succinatimonas hippei]|uniref:relaxase/mobilization nuclease domain-containing protein n=1 Tax=Succinatimonas hippei TaxID=626938 RepID=UPI00249024CC|nr:hypothetical protein [Succinatimonas hippei]